jgi:hypothetical protein
MGFRRAWGQLGDDSGAAFRQRSLRRGRLRRAFFFRASRPVRLGQPAASRPASEEVGGTSSKRWPDFYGEGGDQAGGKTLFAKVAPGTHLDQHNFFVI